MTTDPKIYRGSFCIDCGTSVSDNNLCEECRRNRLAELPPSDSGNPWHSMAEEFFDWIRSNSGRIALSAFGVAIVIYILAEAGCGTVSVGDFTLPPGQLISQEPIQTSVSVSPKSGGQEGWTHSRARVVPLAHYDISARIVMAVGNSLDLVGHIGPIDVTVTWGRMSDTDALNRFRFVHVGRFVGLSSDNPPFSWKEINEQVANMHLIPANEGVAQRLRTLKTDDLVRMTGYLVSVRALDGSWQWSSSLTRTDTGDHACEVMWVDSISDLKVKVKPPPSP